MKVKEIIQALEKENPEDEVIFVTSWWYKDGTYEYQTTSAPGEVTRVVRSNGQIHLKNFPS